MEKQYELIVIGGGPAGLAAALSAWENGLRRVLIIERDRELGGILNQCIHNGFGLHRFKEELTGPEYAGRFIDMLAGTRIEVRLDTMAVRLTKDKCVHTLSAAEGFQVFKADAVILAMGCRERTRGAIGIPGARPAGILTAGAAQRYVNMEGYMVGRRVLILGSGDIGLIMARRMTLEGAKVLACIEVMPYSGGLRRNIVQCLEDYNIPLYLSHTIIDIRGDRRVEQAVVAKVDGNRRPIPGTEMTFDCDTILLSVGLIPENELSAGAGLALDPRTRGPQVFENTETDIPGVFACGNVLQVHDLVDFVSAESERAGKAAADYVLKGISREGEALTVENGTDVGYTVPQRIRPDRTEGAVELFFRVRRILGRSAVVVTSGGETIARFKREYMVPGEMERISIPKKLLEKAAGTITVSAEEVRQ